MTIEIRKGRLILDGREELAISADYPYYRDAQEHWEDRLRKLQGCGITIVTCYIPWRHHQLAPDQAPDFGGITRPNRNVHAVLRACHKLGLWVVAKPGPFIHAETNYGGLPDWVSPANTPAIEAFCDSAGRPNHWSSSQLDPATSKPVDWPLPAPFDPLFRQQAAAWLSSVGRDVIAPHLYPHGPIILTQVANEGVYSNGQHAPWAYDYSPSALALYREQLRARYQSLEAYNRAHGTAHASWQELDAPRTWNSAVQPQELLSYVDWGVFQAEYMRLLYAEWGGAVGAHVPTVVNINPPLDEPYGRDAWLTRTEPERWTSVHYGFTNWIGVVSDDPSAYDRYVLTAKRTPGINWEENWGFSVLYDPAYSAAATSYYQTLLMLFAGATGFNAYTGVATASWDERIDAFMARPYPDCPPISAAGEVTDKAEILSWLAGFFRRHGAEFLESPAPTPVAWGIYHPYARIAAWIPEDEAASAALPSCGRPLRDFQLRMRELGVDYGVVSLEHAHLEELLRYPRLVLHASTFMERAVQEKLAAYVQGGGDLRLLGAAPTLDEQLAPLALLREAGVPVLTQADYQAWLGGLRRHRLLKGRADLWLRSHPERDVHYLAVLLPAHGESVVELRLTLAGREHTLRVEAAPGGAALLRVEQGRLTDAVVKGLNHYLGQAVSAACTLDDARVALDQPGDLAWIDGARLALLPTEVLFQ